MQKVLGPTSTSTIHPVYAASSKYPENNGPSLGKIQLKLPHQRSPYAMKFEDTSQEETERQQRCARGKAWNLAKNIHKLKEKDKATFFSPTDEWSLPAASTIKQEERKFVADSGASMHMVSKKDLNSAELETMRTSRNPTTVMTANGKVQTREDGDAAGRNTRSSFAREALRGSWVDLPLDQRSKTTSHPKWQENLLQDLKLCTIRSPWFIDEFLYNAPTPTSSSSSSQDTVISTENPAAERSEIWVRSHRETRRVDQQKPKTQIKMKTTKNYEVNFKNRQKESLWWIPEQACIWSARETWTLSVQTREEATVYVKELDLFVTVMLLEETPAVLSLGKLCEDHVYTYHWTSGQKPHLTKNGKRIYCKISNCVPFVVPGLSTSSSTTPTPTSSTSSSQGSVVGTENPATERSGRMSAELRGNPSRGSAETKIKMKDAKKHKAIYCMTCRTGWRISEKIWSMKVVLQRHGETLRPRLKTLPVLLMNYQWSREQKWNWVRVSTAFTVTFRRTQIAILLEDENKSASCRTRAGTVVPRAENFGDLTTADHIVLSE